MNLPSLYQLSQEFMEASAKLAEMDLDPQTVADTLEGLQGTLEAKASNVAAFTRNLEATAAAIEVAEEAMARRRKAIEARAEHLREYLRTSMEKTGISKIESPHFAITLKKKPPSVVIFNADLLPANYMTDPPKPAPAPDKSLIAKAIKDGFEVPGAKLSETSYRVEIK